VFAPLPSVSVRSNRKPKSLIAGETSVDVPGPG
jgi:hypothetical protein